MGKLIDLTGQKFGRLTVIKREGTSKFGQAIWLAHCNCGNNKTYYTNSLRYGLTMSCGCFHKEKVTTHGSTGTREFTIWQMMKQRCSNENHVSYKSYGGIGIKVCDKWNNSFNEFIKDVGFAPTNKHTLDRINNNKGYYPDNCKWSTPLEQGKNKRNNRFITFNGITQTVSEWARQLKVSKTCLCYRLNKGWSDHDVITKPFQIR